jgi:creatinine amidohydrolase/Fe(II)-dependent formamide hydrolase-like protein
MMATPVETGKGGASHELSSNGVWTMGDPRDATRELGEKKIRIMVKNAVDFIQAWKKVK